MIPGYQVLAARIQAELEDLDRSVRRVERAWQAAQRAGPRRPDLTGFQSLSGLWF